MSATDIDVDRGGRHAEAYVEQRRASGADGVAFSAGLQRWRIRDQEGRLLPTRAEPDAKEQNASSLRTFSIRLCGQTCVFPETAGLVVPAQSQRLVGRWTTVSPKDRDGPF